MSRIGNGTFRIGLLATALLISSGCGGGVDVDKVTRCRVQWWRLSTEHEYKIVIDGREFRPSEDERNILLDRPVPEDVELYVLTPDGWRREVFKADYLPAVGAYSDENRLMIELTGKSLSHWSPPFWRLWVDHREGPAVRVSVGQWERLVTARDQPSLILLVPPEDGEAVLEIDGREVGRLSETLPQFVFSDMPGTHEVCRNYLVDPSGSRRYRWITQV